MSELHALPEPRPVEPVTTRLAGADGAGADSATGKPHDPPRPKASGAAAAKRPPSSLPSRLMVGAGAVAALSVIGAGLVRYPSATDTTATTTSGKAADSTAAKAGSRKKASAGGAVNLQPVRYVRLKPGQRAPKGAKVIREAAPTPRVIVHRVAAAPVAPAVRTVTRTRQSG
jgi:hypothetical protein